MTGYILRRLLRTLAVVIGISLVVFGLIRAIPGDPAVVILGERGSPEAYEQLREQLGLNKPVFLNFQEPTRLFDAQYPRFVGQLARGDLGAGIKSQIPVADELRSRFPATVELSIAALIFAMLVGLPAGIIAALKRNGFWDNFATTISLVGVSMPVFWLGLLLSYVFAVLLGWLPPSSRLSTGISMESVTGLYVLDSVLRGRPEVTWDALRHLVLPAIALGTIPMAIIARITRSSMLEVLGQDYVRTATAKGLARGRVVLKHALRNAMLPVVTIIGLQVGVLLSGAVLTETIFSWPGLGSWIYDGITNRDYPVIQSGVIFAALIVSVVNLIVDLSYAFLDPRVQYR
ncbi:ABC transporter permease [Deinococcus peraridilitoris]|uniref:ABC-type dipeptide/oligopeptide/nickel transport system, permease component n=1 Tax=Deinococcus peraridilitoris (strain DSM 19664 / LMG 22246 / CIP 109416 / KR-200) TaxID=937777 RepID=K9ZXH8_DEIPD|nr:ABC transporter permease [Deinococcus peraridilitoris]AFZ65909.1 ABC-type dipeptide/oligopeptide/nickel transport system, permease component [Deinococcus peraridilitoris DSM 19664]